MKAEHICIYDLSTAETKLFKANIRIQGDRVLTKLVILDNGVCVKTVLWSNSNGNYEKTVLLGLDTTKVVWVKIEEMGKYSLFVDHWNATPVDASDWGAGNCICSLGSSQSSQSSLRSLANIWSLSLLGHDKRLAKVPIVWNGHDQLIPYFWYFPCQSYNIDCVD